MGGGTVRYPPAAGGVRAGARRSGKTDNKSAPAGAPIATYWRRRFVALGIGLAVVAAAAWSLSNVLEVQSGVKPGTRHGPGAGSWREGGAAQQGGGADAASAAGQGSASLSYSSGGDARTQPAYDGGTATNHGSSPSPSLSAAGGVKPKYCPPQSVVISLRQVKLAASRRPTFSVSVVSTQWADCSFDIGAGQLALVIKQGQVRIWSSADCVAGTAGVVTVLRRGVPAVATIGWSKKTSSPRCDGHARSASPGAYEAYAVDGTVTSEPVAFRTS